MFTGGRNSVIPGDARVIQVDIEPEEIGRNRNIELGIVSDCGEFLRQACEAAKDEKFDPHAQWLERLSAIRNAIRHRFDDALKDGPGPIHPARMVHDIARTLSPDAIVVADGGETAAWMSKCVDGTPSGTIPDAWLSRMPGNRPPVRARMQGGAPRQAGFLHRRRRIGGAQFLGVTYRGEEQPADHRRNQQ
jgi:thiamine pyrophosphate-dependent acetolactate synthase large subunit-like protein